jgi:hypothetical protein
MGVVERVRLGGEVRATREAQPKVVSKRLARQALLSSTPGLCSKFPSTPSSTLRYVVSSCGYDGFSCYIMTLLCFRVGEMMSLPLQDDVDSHYY